MQQPGASPLGTVFANGTIEPQTGRMVSQAVKAPRGADGNRGPLALPEKIIARHRSPGAMPLALAFRAVGPGDRQPIDDLPLLALSRTADCVLTYRPTYGLVVRRDAPYKSPRALLPRPSAYSAVKNLLPRRAYSSTHWPLLALSSTASHTRCVRRAVRMSG